MAKERTGTSHAQGKQRATAILQGRLGSTRLPGKVLLPLSGKPVIRHVYERVLHCRNIDRVIVATTTKPRDDRIAQMFEESGVEVFRGSEDDPLDRYYRAATRYNVKHIVRIMADCPLMDPEIVDEVVEGYFKGDYDLYCLGGEFPIGLDTTVFSYPALERSWRDAKLQSEREHITFYMSNNPDLFRVGFLEKFRGLYHHRWVMDHPQDYEFIKHVYEELYEDGKLFLSGDVLRLLKEKPQLMRINGNIQRGQ